MRIWSTALVGAVVAALALTGCSTSSGVKTSADSGSGSSASSDGGGTKPAKDNAPAKLGATITLEGNEPGSKLSVTLMKVVDPAKSTDEFVTPDPGNRYVAVQFKLTNAGKAAYDDSPSNGAKAIDASGQQFEAALVDKIDAGPVLPAGVKLAPGGSALGFLVFQLPTASKVAKVQFAMDSGFAQAGEWVV